MMNHPAREKQVIVQTDAGGEEVLTEVDVRLYIFEFLQMFLYLDVIKRIRSLQSNFHTNFFPDI